MGLWDWIKRRGRKQIPDLVRPAREIQVAGQTFYLRPMRSAPHVEQASDKLRPEHFEMKVISRQKTVVPGKQILHNEDFD